MFSYFLITVNKSNLTKSSYLNKVYFYAFCPYSDKAVKSDRKQAAETDEAVSGNHRRSDLDLIPPGLLDLNVV